MDEQDERRHERIKLPYVLKFRCVDQGVLQKWDAVIPIDVSESGMCFLTVEKFEINSEVQLLATNSILKEERVYDCKVLRCERLKTRTMFYKTVVTIENMDDDARESYLKVLSSFHDKANKNRRSKRRNE